MERSRRLIVLVVLCSGLVGRLAETILLKPARKLSQQTWDAKPGLLQPGSTLAQALPDRWPEPCPGCPQQGPMSSPASTPAAWVVLQADDEAQQKQMGVSGQGSLGAFAQTCKRCLEAWKTFGSATLPVTVDYLLDWSVQEEAAGVTFTSAQGATISHEGVWHSRARLF
jgi:hypothetical protein